GGAQGQDALVHLRQAEDDDAAAGPLHLAAQVLRDLLGGDLLQPGLDRGIEGRRRRWRGRAALAHLWVLPLLYGRAIIIAENPPFASCIRPRHAPTNELPALPRNRTRSESSPFSSTAHSAERAAPGVRPSWAPCN